MDAVAQAFQSDRILLTPGGTETYLMFQQGYPLRDMCAFDVLMLSLLGTTGEPKDTPEHQPKETSEK